jgi:hypothetical protein
MTMSEGKKRTKHRGQSGGQFKLQRHQRDIADYIVSRCSDIPGILLYHKMGTGKTVTAIAALMSYASRRRVVVAPAELVEDVWAKEIKALGIAKDAIELYSYETAFPAKRRKSASATDASVPNFDDAVVVFDEAHTIPASIFRDEAFRNDDVDMSHISERIANSHKVLLLTGTPVVNVHREFMDLALLINLASRTKLLPMNNVDFRHVYYRTVPHKALVGGWVTYIIMYPAELLSMWALLSGILSVLNPRNWFRKRGGSGDGAPVMTGGMTAGFGFMSLLLPQLITFMVWKLGLRRGIRVLDVPKFLNAVRGYVSYYDISGTSEDYPSYDVSRLKVEYTEAQVEQYVKYSDGVLSYSSLVRIFDDAKRGELELAAQNLYTTPTQFLSEARRFGNMNTTGRSGITWCPKFVEIASVMEAVKYQNCAVWSHFLPDLQKFEKFLDELGVTHQMLSPASTQAERVAVLDKFKSGAFQVLLVHPDYYQGVSIKGARQLHILEPCVDILVEAQIIGRVVRYKSHAHLPKSKRHVDVFIWAATSQAVQPIVAKMVAKYKHWLKFHKYTFPGSEKLRAANFGMTLDATADDIIDMFTKNMQSTLDDMVKHLKQDSGGLQCPFDTDASRQCCVWEPDAGDVAECVSTTGRRKCQ